MEGKPGEWTVSAAGHCPHGVVLPSLHIDSDSDRLGLGHPAASCSSNFIIKSHHLENLGLPFLSPMVTLLLRPSELLHSFVHLFSSDQRGGWE